MPRHLLLKALAFSFTLASSTAFAADKVAFQLDWFPGGDKAPVYIGIQRGFFAAEGLELTLQSGRGSSDSITKLAMGTADFGTAGINALMSAAAEANVPVRGIFSVYSKQPDSLFTLKGSGITSLKNLAGKTVATATFTSSNTIWPVILATNGVNEADVKLLKMEPGAVVPMLAAGRVDATISWVTAIPGAQSMVQQAGKELQVLPWSDFGLEGYATCLYATDKVLKERPEVAVRFVRAFKKAVELAVAQPDVAALDVKKMAPEIDAALTIAELRSALPLIKNAVSDKDGLGAFEPALLRKTWEWVAKAQKYPLDKLDPEKLVDRSVLKKS